MPWPQGLGSECGRYMITVSMGIALVQVMYRSCARVSLHKQRVAAIDTALAVAKLSGSVQSYAAGTQCNL